MGLCKCPKRRVTNMFCFEHCVNVCEDCVATNHTKCIIQSYLQWLQDSDYNPICELCSKALLNEDCIRLTCYHIFHWSCLDCYARQLPATTAPAGYHCPSCKSCIFPPENLIGPVVNGLREKLSGVNWARNGLGLPLLSEDRELKPIMIKSGIDNNGKVINNGTIIVDVNATNTTGNKSIYNRETGEFQNQNATATTTNSLINNNVSSNRRLGYHDGDDNVNEHHHQRTIVFDHDDDKYKRRPPGEWMRRWWKNALGSQNNNKVSRGGGSLYKRYCAAGLTIFLTIVLLLIVMSKLGRYSVEDDPNLDLYNNPQVHNN